MHISPLFFALALVASPATATDSGEELPPVRVASVEITGVGGVERQRIIRSLGLNPGAELGERKISAAMERIVRHFADRGYPFCTAGLTGLDLAEDGRAVVSFTVDRGRFVRLGEVNIRTGRTRPDILRRLTGLAPGEPYSERTVERARGRLLASGLFRRVDSVRINRGRSEALADIALEAEEFPGSRIEAALGTGGGNSRGIAGLVSLRMNNLFGTARTASLNWRRPAVDWQSLEVGYREPWLAGFPLAVEFSFSQQVRDSLFSQTGAEVALDAEMGDRFRAGLGVVYSSVSPGSETWTAAESSRLWAVSGRAVWSNILPPVNPSEGFRIAAAGSIGNRRVSGVDSREVRATVDGELYRRIGLAHHVAALSGGVSLVSRGDGTPGEIPWHARIPVGGTLAGGVPVRGHPEETTRAVRSAWLGIEYRLLTGDTGRLFVFYDLAVIEQASQQTGSWRTSALHGIGGGIQAGTRLGLLEIAVAVDPERGPGEGRVHVRLAESF